MTEYTQPSVWHVPTEQSASSAYQLAYAGDHRTSSLESLLLIVPSEGSEVPSLTSHEKQFTGYPVEVLRSNVVLVCLLLDGVTTFAKVWRMDLTVFSQHS